MEVTALLVLFMGMVAIVLWLVLISLLVAEVVEEAVLLRPQAHRVATEEPAELLEAEEVEEALRYLLPLEAVLVARERMVL